MQHNLPNRKFIHLYNLGIFSNDHLPYAYLQREKNLDVPSLSEMMESAIKVLDKGNEGYFLLVIILLYHKEYIIHNYSNNKWNLDRLILRERP